MSKRKSQRSNMSTPAKRTKVEQVTSHPNTALSDYEKAILENIRKNNEVLSELNIFQVQHDLRITKSVTKSESKSRSLKFQTRMKITAEEQIPTRQSLRIRRLEPDGVTQLPEKPLTTLPSTWEKPRHRGAIKMVLASDGEEEEKDPKALLSTLDDFMNKTKQSTSSFKLYPDCLSYKKQADKLNVKEHHVTKVVPSRIYSLTFHGMEAKTLLFAGDKKGNLGLWDIDSTEANNVFVYEPHTGPVVTIATDPFDPNKVLTCSYDGTIRCADFGKTVFHEVCALDEDDSYFTYMAFGTTSSHTLLASRGDGQMQIVDYRNNKGNYPHYHLHDRTIKCLDVHPQNQNIFVTSTNKGTISLWDVRKLSSSTCSVIHSRSVSSVFFSPMTGQQLLATTMDDLVVVYDVHNYSVTKEKATMFRHNNQTGRWLSTFHATWDPKTDMCFAVGSMRYPRQVDIYSSRHKAGALTHLQHDNFTTITSRIAFHPSHNVIAAGNSSGKVSLWTAC